MIVYPSENRTVSVGENRTLEKNAEKRILKIDTLDCTVGLQEGDFNNDWNNDFD